MLLFFSILAIVCICLYLVFLENYRKPGIYKYLHIKASAAFRQEISAREKEEFFFGNDLGVAPENLRPLASLLLSCGGENMIYSGNSFETITSGARKRELLLADIENAREFIFMEYFRFMDDKAGREVRDALYRKAEQGVEVCFLHNNMIGRRIPRSYFRDFRRHGIKLVPYTHLNAGLRKWIMRIDHQNHRKIVVIDGKVAYTGGMNISDNYFELWRDTHLRIQGPVISRFTASFMDSWIGSGGSFNHRLGHYFRRADIASEQFPYNGKTLQVVTDAPEYPVCATLEGIIWIINNAKRYVFLQTPYFVPPKPLLDAMKQAVVRGVELRLMVPKKMDTPFVGPVARSYYRECIAAGIHLLLHDGAFIHSKTVVADDAVAVIGASNLDYRSFGMNEEVNVFIYDSEVAADCRTIFERDMSQAREMTLETWRRERRWYQKLASAFMRLPLIKEQF